MKIRLLLAYRQASRHPFLVLLNIVGVALGVSVVLAIDLTNASAERAFTLASRQVSGSISHQLIPDRGLIDEILYVRLRNELGIRHAYPVIEGRVSTADGQRYGLIGIDPLSFTSPGTLTGHGSANGLFMTTLLKPGTAVVSADLLRPGQVPQLEIHYSNSKFNLELVDLQSSPVSQSALSSLFSNSLVTDIATAQEIFNMRGSLSRVDMELTADQAIAVTNLLPPGVRMVSAAAGNSAMLQMTRAFRINLQALSLLALLIGAFLIFNTMTISILQRREQIATMRAIGLSRQELVLIILLEVAVIAFAGILAGSILGTMLSKVLILLVSQTMSDLYFIDQITSVYLSPSSYMKAMIMGLLTVVGACLYPLREVVRIPPEISRSRSRLESVTRKGHARLIQAALGLIIAGSVLLVVDEDSIYSGFIALALIILALAMLVPPVMVVLMRIFEKVLYRLAGTYGTLACRNVISSLSRTQVAVTALAIAVSATIGVSIMISSFRISVQEWLNNILQADIYISVQVNGAAAGISDDALDHINTLPGVIRSVTGFWHEMPVDGVPVQVTVRDLAQQDFRNYQFINGNGRDNWEAYSTTDSVIISEPYAYHNHLSMNDQIEFVSGTGSRRFAISGIFRDYSSDRGVISMHADVYKQYWPDYHTTSLALYLQPGTDSAALAGALNSGLLAQYDLIARPNRQLREISMQIFNRTFAVTEVLRLITVIIAVAGILGALTAIQLERSREFAVLRTTGMTPGETFRLVWMESGLIGILAGIMAVPMGIVMAALLIFIINRRSFGWSMEFIVAPEYPASAIVLGLAAGLLAGTWPAWRQTSRLPAVVLRDE